MSQIIEGLEVDADRPLQEKFWFWQRVGWMGMLLLVIAAVVGLTGNSGPLSSGKVEAGTSTVDYPRISRWRAADSLSVSFGDTAGTTGTILLPQEFLHAFTIDMVTPQPTRVLATSKGLEFHFALAADAAPREVHFAITPQLPTFPSEARGTVSGRPYSFSFTILP